jgi:hypothetical protein
MNSVCPDFYLEGESLTAEEPHDQRPEEDKLIPQYHGKEIADYDYDDMIKREMDSFHLQQSKLNHAKQA